MKILREILWGPHVLLMILFTGVMFTVRGRFMQFSKIPRLLPGALSGHGAHGEKISPFQALSTSLAGSLGTGNIVGVAAAITAGGPGAIVWMWISALFGMMTVYAESVLAIRFCDPERPGAVGYIHKTLGSPAAKFYAAGCVLSALGMGTMAQTGAISAALGSVHIPPWAAGMLATGLLLLCVKGGMQKAVRVTEKLVPFMAAVFLLACGGVLVLRAKHIPVAIMQMLHGAFSFRAVSGGAVGMWMAMKVGVSRGVFTNEAGLGSGTFALCRTQGKTAEQVGALGALQVFIDTLFLCTVTALCLLVSPGVGEGAMYTLSSFSEVLGHAGSAAVSVSMALFAFATVIAWSCYGMDALRYLVPAEHETGRKVFLLFAAVSCFLGCMIPFNGVLRFCDVFNGMMAIPNILALVRLSGCVFEKNSGKIGRNDAKFTQNAKKL